MGKEKKDRKIEKKEREKERGWDRDCRRRDRQSPSRRSRSRNCSHPRDKKIFPIIVIGGASKPPSMELHSLTEDNLALSTVTVERPPRVAMELFADAPTKVTSTPETRISQSSFGKQIQAHTGAALAQRHASRQGPPPCFAFTSGKCFRENCRFLHLGPGGPVSSRGLFTGVMPQATG